VRLGRLPEALADFKAALEMAHEDGSRDEEVFRLFHALTEARRGDLSELALLGDQARDILKTGAGSVITVYYYWMIYYDAACVHAGLSQLALRDQGRPPVERRRLAAADLERALELLDKARAAGELQGGISPDGAIMPEEYRREPLLDPLRSHPRFQLLMMDLAFPADPFRP
jgi:hypothetical protein